MAHSHSLKLAQRPWQALYDARWRKLRVHYLRAHPWCVMCHADGALTPATAVDHKRPHKGDLGLFWNQDNWQALCRTHHSSTKQRMETNHANPHAYAPGNDDQGYPTDPNHPWRGAAKR